MLICLSSGGGRPQSPEEFHRASGTGVGVGGAGPPGELRKRGSSSDAPHGAGAGALAGAGKRNSQSHGHGHHRGHSGSWDDDRNNLSEGKKALLSDLRELYGCRPSVEIFERSWRRDAVFEVCVHSCCLDEGGGMDG